MKALHYLFIFVFFASLNGSAQFSLLESSITNTVINKSNEDTYLFSFKSDGIIKFRLENNALVTTSLSVPQNSTTQVVNALDVITNDVLLVRIEELNDFVFANHYYLSINGAKSWAALVTPDGKSPLYTYADEFSGMMYFYKANNTGYYTYQYTSGQWDSIQFNATPFDIIKIKNGVGYLQLIDKGSDKLGYTVNGGKSYQIVANIDYTKAPFTWEHNGILQKIIMVSESHWYAQYQFDSVGVQVSKLLATTDKGANWKEIMNTNVAIIQPASNNSVYVYKQNGAKGILYQVSDYGNKICPTTFTGRVQSMNFWDAKNGLIFALDSTTSQYGVWLVTNGGGANCYTQTSNGVQEVSKVEAGMNIYPNPATHELNIEIQYHQDFDANNTSGYTIQNLTGQVVLKGDLTISQEKTEIDISSLSSGIYVVKANGKAQKFVKN